MTIDDNLLPFSLPAVRRKKIDRLKAKGGVTPPPTLISLHWFPPHRFAQHRALAPAPRQPPALSRGHKFAASRRTGWRRRLDLGRCHIFELRLPTQAVWNEDPASHWAIYCRCTGQPHCEDFGWTNLRAIELPTFLYAVSFHTAWTHCGHSLPSIATTAHAP